MSPSSSPPSPKKEERRSPSREVQVEIPIRPPTPEPTSTDAPSALPAVLIRPPIRPAPVAGVSKSKFELEPNPFEQSFSRSSTSVQRTTVRTHTGSSSEDAKPGSSLKRTREGTTEGGDEGTEDGAQAPRKTSSGGRDTPGEKTALPPLSALTSPVPVDPASHFSWSGLSSSLRAGPLSPAMLAGPTSASQAQHGQSGNDAGGPGAQNSTHHGGFDPNTFRTGFTPGVSGFTPNYTGLLTAGGGFPMPSPNTAAFLSMVTNGTPGGGATGQVNGQQQESGKPENNGVGGHVGVNPSAIPSHLQAPTPSATVDITPNTLNALTGVINQMNGSESNAVGTMFPPPPPPAQQSHEPPNGATGHSLPPPPHPDHPMSNAPDYFSHGASHNVHAGPQHHHQQPMSLPPAHLHASADPRVHVPGAYDMHHQQAMMNANAQAQAAAAAGTGGPLNGLFLLSQAHQELSKREEEQRDVNGTAGRPRVGSGGSTRGKRKSEDNGGKSGTGAGGRPAGNKRSKKNGTQDTGPIRNLPAYPGQSILQQSQALLAQGLQAQAERDAMQEEADDDEDQKMLDLAGHAGKDGVDGDGKTGGKPETEEEKRKNFLERNRQAALKCRQRKKAWLTQLQTKVDGLTEENERLKAMLTSITDEAQKLSAVLSSHRDCPGMAASMAQLGLTLPQMPPPPPPQAMHMRQMSVAPPAPSMGMPFVQH